MATAERKMQRGQHVCLIRHAQSQGKQATRRFDARCAGKPREHHLQLALGIHQISELLIGHLIAEALVGTGVHKLQNIVTQPETPWQ